MGYADDFTTVATADAEKEARNKLEANVNNLVQGLKDCGMVVNCAKTNCMSFTGKLADNDNNFAMIGGHKIMFTQNVKILGFHVDKELNWSVHVEKVCKNTVAAYSGFKSCMPTKGKNC